MKKAASSKFTKALIVASLALLLAGGLIAGCMTSHVLEPGAGYKARVHGRAYAQVWDAAMAAVGSQLFIEESDRVAGVIRAKSESSLKSWGGVAAVFITPASRPSGVYTVEIVSKAKAQWERSSRNWEWDLMEEIRKELRR